MKKYIKFKENFLFVKSDHKLKTKIQNVIKTILYYLFRIIPINRKKIVFQSFKGMGYIDSPKYIHKQILNENLDVKCVWLTKHQYIEQFPNSIKLVPYNSIRGIYELATAKIWIDNCRKESNVRKRKKQFYIETWHNGISLKRVEKSVESNLSKEYVKSAKNDSKLVNVFISNSDFATKRLKKDFWYNGKIIESGLPRNDVFFQDETVKRKIKKKICDYFNIQQDTKILLYAPTFRRNFNTDIYLKDLSQVIQELNKRFGGKWVPLVHLHPNVAYKSKEIKYSDTYINSNNYYDFQELILCSDILLTDYSSTMFEFSFDLKPVFLFMSDLEAYIKDRNFEISLTKLPYPIANDLKNLKENICNFNEEKYNKELSVFLKSLGIKERGQASQIIVNEIKKELTK